MRTDPALAALRRTRLAELFQSRDQTGVSAITGISLSQFGQWLSGFRAMSEGSARKIEHKLGLPERWFDLQKSAPDVLIASELEHTVLVPIVSWVRAGELTEAFDPYPPGGGNDFIRVERIRGARLIALIVKGASMAPDFNEGDTIIVDLAASPRPGDCVVAKNGRNEATFKKYRARGTAENGAEIFELAPLNPDYETLRSDLEPLRIVGVLVESRKKWR